ncbi:MAG: hypothetical protein OIF56_11660 [Cohaesibacter sp.]|nr:hypothetical protein [Cohaesibacter sp.]
MKSKTIHFDAVDTLMFRDGKPFNQSDAGASEASSIFPPYPPTLVGAVRAMLWQESLDGKWIEDALGNGTNWQQGDSLGNLRFGAPIVMKNSRPVFPVPLHVVTGEPGKSGKTGEKSKIKPLYSQLSPGPKRECDLKSGGNLVRLPKPMNGELEGIKVIEDRWLTLEGMKKVLAGHVSFLAEQDFIKRSDLWQTEPRVGIGIDSQTRIVSDSQLYMASHIRMADDVTLALTVEGWPEPKKAEKQKPFLRPLAGEHRVASIHYDEEVLPIPAAVRASGQTKTCVIAISPVVPDPDNDFAILGLPDECVISACLGKPVSIGGWNSISRCPIPLRQCIPAGSVWFMEDGWDSDIGDHIGLAQEWGFGQILIGTYQ